MKRKYFFPLISFFLIAVFSYMIFLKMEEDYNNQKSKQAFDYEIIKRRYQSLISSFDFIGDNFPIKIIYKLEDDSLFLTSFKGYNIVAILTDLHCDCQIRELKDIDAFYEKLSKKKTINIFAIYDGSRVMDAVFLKKRSNASFPFYYTHGKEFDFFSFTKRYPLIFFVNGQKILYSLIPLPNDTLLSSYFYRNLSQILTN